MSRLLFIKTFLVMLNQLLHLYLFREIIEIIWKLVQYILVSILKLLLSHIKSWCLRYNRSLLYFSCNFLRFLEIILGQSLWFDLIIFFKVVLCLSWVDAKAAVDLLHYWRWFKLGQAWWSIILWLWFNLRLFDILKEIVDCLVSVKLLLYLMRFTLLLLVDEASKSDLWAETFELVGSFDVNWVIKESPLLLDKLILFDIINLEVVLMCTTKIKCSIFGFEWHLLLLIFVQ